MTPEGEERIAGKGLGKSTRFQNNCLLTLPIKHLILFVQMLYLKCKGALEESSLRVIQRRMNYFSGNYFNHTKSHKEL